MADKKRVLIVEDDENISMVEETYLEASGYDAVVVGDAEGAERELDKGGFDLILLDLMLPGKNGDDICCNLREKVDIPILMVTARTETVDKIRGFGAGADDYIAKPFDPAELVARVNANLRQNERAKKNASHQSDNAQEEIKIDDLGILTKS